MCTILCIFIYLLVVLIYCIVRTVRVLTLSYEASLSRRFPDNPPITLSLMMTIGSVSLMSSISLGITLDFVINSISSAFWPLVIWVDTSQAWLFVPFSSRERGHSCVFLQASKVIFADDSLKVSDVSTRTEFMWNDLHLRFTWSLIQFILALTCKLLSFKFGPLLFDWSFTDLNAFRMKYWM